MKNYFILILSISLIISINAASLPKIEDYHNSFDGWQHYYQMENFALNNKPFNLLPYPYPFYLHITSSIAFLLFGFSLKNMTIFYNLFVLSLSLLNFLIYYFIGKKVLGFKFGIIAGILSSLIMSSDSWLGLIWPFPSTIAYVFLPLIIYYLSNLNKNKLKVSFLIPFIIIIHPWSIVILTPFVFFIFIESLMSKKNIKSLAIISFILIIPILLIFVIFPKEFMLFYKNLFQTYDFLPEYSIQYLIKMPMLMTSFLGLIFLIRPNKNYSKNKFFKFLIIGFLFFLLIILFSPFLSKRFILHLQLFMVFLSSIFLYKIKKYFSKISILLIIFLLLSTFIIFISLNNYTYSQTKRINNAELNAFNFLMNTSKEEFILSDKSTLRLARPVIPKFGFEEKLETLEKDDKVIHDIFFNGDLDSAQINFLCQNNITYIIITPRTRYWIETNVLLSLPTEKDMKKTISEIKFKKYFNKIYSFEKIDIYEIEKEFCQ